MKSNNVNNRRFTYNTLGSGIVNISKAILQLVMLPIMARLLSPTDYGIYALALPTILFFVLLADGGLGVSLSREDESNYLVWSTAFWSLAFVSLFMAAGVIASGFLLSRLTGEASLVGIMALLSLSLPILVFKVPADARLIRRGNLIFHSISDLLGSFIGAGVAIVLAYRGAGAWSLAAQYVVSFFIRALILNFVAWVNPGFAFKLSSLQGHLKIAAAIIISRLAELAGKLAENYIFGLTFQVEVLGKYNIANQVSRFSCEAFINPIVGPFYAHILHLSDLETKQLHFKFVRFLLMSFFPIVMLVSVVAKELFIIALGEKWADASVFFQVIAAPYCLLSISWFSSQILMKHGLVRKITAINVVFSIVRVVMVTAGFFCSPIVIGSLIGLSYVSQAYMSSVIVPERLCFSLVSILFSIWRQLLFFLASFLLSIFVLAWSESGTVGSLASFSGGLFLYILLLFMFTREEILSNLSLIISSIKRNRTQN